MIGNTKDSFCCHRLLFVFLFDVFLTGATQAALTFGLTAATALFSVLLTVCKIIISHRHFNDFNHTFNSV